MCYSRKGVGDMGVLVPAHVRKREVSTMPARIPSSSDHLDSVGFIGGSRGLVGYDGNWVELTRGEERDSRNSGNERQKTGNSSKTHGGRENWSSRKGDGGGAGEVK